MKKTIIILLVIVGIIACQSPKEKALKEISDIENNDSAFSTALMENLKVAYIKFAENYPDDEKSAGFLFKAAQRCIALNQTNEAINILDNILAKYPKSEVSEEVSFLLAYTYENSANDLDKAKIAYQNFLNKYPKSELAEDATLAIKNLGKTPEEIIEAAGN